MERGGRNSEQRQNKEEKHLEKSASFAATGHVDSTASTCQKMQQGQGPKNPMRVPMIMVGDCGSGAVLTTRTHPRAYRGTTCGCRRASGHGRNQGRAVLTKRTHSRANRGSACEYRRASDQGGSRGWCADRKGDGNRGGVSAFASRAHPRNNREVINGYTSAFEHRTSRRCFSSWLQKHSQDELWIRMWIFLILFVWRI